MFINRSLTCVSNLCKQIQRVNVTPVGRRCSQLSTDNAQPVPESGKKVSKAMKAYLERSRAYNEFMQREADEYNIGKRHLANMMGKDAETFTQQDIDEAIEYLLPSGLFEKKARPMMKPPHLIFPPKKDAEFDESGRPFHFLFYTGKPNFYNIMHEIVSHMNNLTNEENEILRGNKAGTKEKNLVGTKWLSKTELEQYTVESLTDNEYQNFVVALERLSELSQAALVKDFIMKLRSPLMDSVMKFEAEKPSYDMNGRAYIITRDCPRKDARADVTVYSPGTGKISINNQGIEYFSTIQARNQILYPLELTGLRTSVDIVATVTKGGETGQAGAIRWGISWGLKSFVSKDMIETMRLAGLLTRDFRRRERKKPGQAKARKKFTWKKR